MPNIEVFINSTNKPQNLSDDPRVIVEHCRRARAAPLPNLNKPRGIPVIDTPHTTVPYAWVKYGNSIQRGEAWMQHFVASTVNAHPMCPVRVPHIYLAFQWDDCVFIVMEYIHGSPCTFHDIPLVASAVCALIQIQAPPAADAAPAPLHGGFIEHPIFVDSIASVVYNSVAQLESHLTTLTFPTDPRAPGPRSDRRFRDRSEGAGLRLCPSDMDSPNFIRDMNGMIVAIDFGSSCFLPPSFFSHALHVATGSFPQLLAREIVTTYGYPRSAQLSNMLDAAYTLVPYGKNSIALPDDLRMPPRRRNTDMTAS
ncbi:hypothetical protein D9619_013708 [Psilocybe cf. subviscida]|uniref:Protein kinase domain-containing protein n=1 Tax=Psilocybe cf. subviscida TaxID=2480587 RepID=A0A8H5EVG4_9AGAR|nr:hypothetical protein D9619_013708 [Psilocybe cf. subviscida]